MINSTLNRVLSSNSCDYWLAQLEAQRIPCAPVNSLSQALADTQVVHRNMVVDLKHPNGKSTKGPGNPIKLSRSTDQDFTAAPTLGQHTEEVMTQLLNLSVQQVDQLREAGNNKMTANRVVITDVGPRDGLQNQPKILTT